MAAVLAVAPGAALAGRRVRAAGTAARTRKGVKCKRRAGEARLDIGCVIGREARTPPRRDQREARARGQRGRRRRPHDYSAAEACELPSSAELVRHGGVLIKPARGGGDGRVGRCTSLATSGVGRQTTPSSRSVSSRSRNVVASPRPRRACRPRNSTILCSSTSATRRSRRCSQRPKIPTTRSFS